MDEKKTDTEVRIRPDPNKEYEYFTTQLRYLDDKIIQVSLSFVGIATAIIGGSFYLFLNPRHEELERFSTIVNLLFVCLGFGHITIILNNLQSWRDHRGKISTKFDVDPSKSPRWWINEIIMCILMSGVVAGFIYFNPLNPLDGHHDIWALIAGTLNLLPIVWFSGNALRQDIISALAILWVSIFIRPYLIYVSGYFISVLGGHFVIRPINNWMRQEKDRLSPQNSQEDQGGLLSGLVGLTERILFTTVLLAHHPEFIGLWLTLKFAGRWREWQPDTPGGWGRVNIFLVGNALSILFSFIGATIIKPDLFFK